MKNACLLFTWAGIVLLVPVCAQAVVVYDDGLTHEITTPVGRIEVRDGQGPTTVVVRDGGSVGSVVVLGHSTFRMAGGLFPDGSLYLYEFAQAEFSGGRIDDNPTDLWDESSLTVTGGEFLVPIRAHDDSQAFIYGTNFRIDGNPVPYGAVTLPIGELTGELTNGRIQSTFMIFDDAAITLVPEPATLSLLALGGAMLRRRKSEFLILDPRLCGGDKLT